MMTWSSTGRGPTMMHEVHMRPPEQREAIILNEYGQPVRPVTPEKDTVVQFSHFLGTISCCYDNAPLTHKIWKLVPRKEKLWEPKTVPEEDFKKLLILWNKKEEKDRCAANQSRRKAQKNNHTAGPKSFARIREDMKTEDPDKQPPSLEAMKSFQPNEDGSGPKDAFLSVMNKDYPGRRRLYGRGVTNKELNKGHATAVLYVVPTEVIDKLSADMEARNTQVADIKKDLKADYQEKKANLEADYAKKMEEL
ncbi:RNA-directed RNA polymerase L [Bienertia sinuspersici]